MLSDGEISKEECDELKEKVKVELLQKKNFLQTPSYLSFEVDNLPPVFPEEVEPEPLHRNENQMHQRADETTPTKKNILEVVLEDENEQLSSDNRDFNDGEPQRKRLKKKRCTRQKTKKMHDKEKQVARTNKFLTKLFPNKVAIHMLQDEALLSTWKQQLG